MNDSLHLDPANRTPARANGQWKTIWRFLALAAAIALMAFGAAGCDGGDDDDLSGQLTVTVDPNCQDEGSVRIWLDGNYLFQLAPGESRALPSTPGQHQLYAVNDRGREWNRSFSVNVLDSTILLSCQ